MILADLGQNLSFIVFIIWIVASILGSKKKKRLKQMKEQAIARKREDEKKKRSSQPEIRKKETPLEVAQKRNREVLENAERQVQSQPAPSRPTPRGQDLEIRIEDLFDAIRHPQPETDPELGHKLEVLESENQKLRNKAIFLQRKIDKLNSSQPAEAKSSTTAYDEPNSSIHAVNKLSDNLPQAIIWSEILGKPKSIQKMRRR